MAHTGLHASLTEAIISAAIEVHRELGPGLLETVYERALCVELTERGIPFKRQVAIPLFYKGELISEHHPDLIVDNAVVVEIKSVARLDEVFTAQLLTYLRVCGLRVGLLINFNRGVLHQGVRRVVL